MMHKFLFFLEPCMWVDLCPGWSTWTCLDALTLQRTACTSWSQPAPIWMTPGFTTATTFRMDHMQTRLTDVITWDVSDATVVGRIYKGMHSNQHLSKPTSLCTVCAIARTVSPKQVPGFCARYIFFLLSVCLWWTKSKKKLLYKKMKKFISSEPFDLQRSRSHG